MWSCLTAVVAVSISRNPGQSGKFEFFPSLESQGKSFYLEKVKEGHIIILNSTFALKRSNRSFSKSFPVWSFSIPADAKCPNNLNSLHMNLSKRSWEVMESLWHNVLESLRIHVRKSVGTLYQRSVFENDAVCSLLHVNQISWKC